MAFMAVLWKYHTQNLSTPFITGCFFLVSHINAHTSKGQEWLEQVVLVGLRKGGADAGWAIEVHGNDNATEEDVEESPGPAVYMIFKRKLEDSSDNNGEPRVPLQFFNY